MIVPTGEMEVVGLAFASGEARDASAKLIHVLERGNLIEEIMPGYIGRTPFAITVRLYAGIEHIAGRVKLKETEQILLTEK